RPTQGDVLPEPTVVWVEREVRGVATVVGQAAALGRVPNQLATAVAPSARVPVDTTRRAWMPERHPDHLRAIKLLVTLPRVMAYHKTASQRNPSWPSRATWDRLDARRRRKVRAGKA